MWSLCPHDRHNVTLMSLGINIKNIISALKAAPPYREKISEFQTKSSVYDKSLKVARIFFSWSEIGLTRDNDKVGGILCLDYTIYYTIYY